MKKIKTVFEYTEDYEMAEEYRDCNQWVKHGFGYPTTKFDGEAVCWDGTHLYRRKTLKPNQYQDGMPDDWIPAQAEPRSDNGKWPGWRRAVEGAPNDQWAFEGLENTAPEIPGTFELVGPKVQGNPHKFDEHQFKRHGTHRIDESSFERSREGLKTFLKDFAYEGIVFHHPGGGMAKIRRKDFGFDWPV